MRVFQISELNKTGATLLYELIRKTYNRGCLMKPKPCESIYQKLIPEKRNTVYITQTNHRSKRPAEKTLLSLERCDVEVFHLIFE